MPSPRRSRVGYREVAVRSIATRIAPGLWQGGVERHEGAGKIVLRGVDAVVLLECDAGVDVLAPVVRRSPLQDHPSDLDYLPELHAIARDMAAEVARGGEVAVLCFQGRNRSGLVMGLILCELGMPGADAVRLIRRRRKRDSLSTRGFATYLRSL